MTDKTQPEALRLANEFKLCNEYDSIPSITDIAKAETELRRQHARIAELEAIGAGGAVPLTDGQMAKLYRQSAMRDRIMVLSDWEQGVRDAEAAHGIKGG